MGGRNRARLIGVSHGSCYLVSHPFTERPRSFTRTSTTVTTIEKTPAAQAPDDTAITREQLIENLNGDLAREYQAIIAYVVYSQAIKGAQFMRIAKELETHAGEELAHALTISKQIDYLGGSMTVTPKPVKTSEHPNQMLRFDLENEAETLRQYRERVRQCEALGEFAVAESIREIMLQEQDHLIDLANALGEYPPDVSS